MRERFLKCLLLMIIVLGLSHPASAFSGAENQAYSPGTGHEVPTPFGIGNRKYELANGQIYTLVGRVNWPYFLVDLSRHPLLVSHGKLTKEYLLEGSESEWKEMQHDYVKLTFRAHGKIFLEGSKPTYKITLEYLPDDDESEEN